MVHSALARSREDPAAFARFYADEATRLLAFFARRLLDPEAALDLTAETFAQAFAGRGGFRGTDEEAARGWLYAIARRQLARYLERGYADRSARERLGVERPEATAEELLRVEELAALSEIRAGVAEQLRALPPAHREAVRLRVVEELGYPEVAARLDITEDAARARVSRGLRRIARHIRPEGEPA
jgi:RNA polymerase sigma-70 factor (ECF subfamily)